jgi:hypothetical protein
MTWLKLKHYLNSNRNQKESKLATIHLQNNSNFSEKKIVELYLLLSWKIAHLLFQRFSRLALHLLL